jgi:hypothetical protein
MYLEAGSITIPGPGPGAVLRDIDHFEQIAPGQRLARRFA